MYKGENEEDTVKTLSQYSDVIVIRHSIPGRVEYLAQYSDVPVINGGDGSNEHPTQALIDLDTIEQYIHNKDEVKIMFTGDLYYSRTINSLIKLLKEDKYKFIVTNIVNEEIAENLKKRSLIRKSYISIEENQIPDMIDSVDVLYMTRNQTERQHRGILPSQFVLTNDLANKMAVDAIIMHPLPRNHEICPSVDKNIRAKYFNQVENGLYVRMALLNLMTK
jgi:carbamoyl-phosphate synthase/aspartate carbamoyltransferase